MPGPPSVSVSIATLTALLQTRLGDQTFWVQPELDLYIRQAIREFQVLTNYWRTPVQLVTAPNAAFYDLAATGVIPYNAVDLDILNQVGYHLLEFDGTQSSPINTQQFVIDALTTAFSLRRQEILGETRLVVQEYAGNAPGPPPGTGRLTLSSGVLQVHRVEWFDVPSGLWNLVSRSDELGAYGWAPGWPQAQIPNTPGAYSSSLTPPFQLQFIPPPQNTGYASILITACNLYSYTGLPQLVGLPDDSVYALPWGILASMLNQDAQSRDYKRAMYAQMRFRRALEILKTWPCVLNTYPAGLQYLPSTLYALDHWAGGWRNQTPASPNVVAIGGRNLVACSPVPDQIYDIELDCVVNSPASTVSRNTNFDMAGDIVDAILGNGYHLAAFKLQGQEWEATTDLYKEFLGVAQAYADRERAQSINWKDLLGVTVEENAEKPYEAEKVEV